MTRIIFITMSLLGLLSVQAQSYPLAVVAGEPDMSLDFVDKLVGEEIEIPGDAYYEADLTTKIYSILWQRMAPSTVLVKALFENQALSLDEAIDALENAASHAAVVLWILRGDPNSNQIFCHHMANHPDVAFVIPAGSEGALALHPALESDCFAPNILVTATLDQVHGELASFSNFGPGVRVAAPGIAIPVVGFGGHRELMTGAIAALSITAADLAVHAVDFPEFSGARLIASFLLSNTQPIESLTGLVEGSRMLVNNLSSSSMSMMP